MKAKKRRKTEYLLMVILLFSGLISFGFSLHSQKEEPYAAEETASLEGTKSYVAGITAGGLSGNGILYEVLEDSLLLVTANHVLDLADGTVLVTFSSGESAEGNIWYRSDTSDLALILVPFAELAEGVQDAFETAPRDREAFDALQTGSIVTYRTYEREMRVGSVTDPWIYLEDFGQHMLLCTGEIASGDSGGGVFAEDGALLGIILGVSEEGDVAVLPLSVIEAELDKFPELLENSKSG